MEPLKATFFDALECDATRDEIALRYAPPSATVIDGKREAVSFRSAPRADRFECTDSHAG
jgi:hypothetical protein